MKGFDKRIVGFLVAVVLLLVALPSQTYAQSRKQLEKKRKRLLGNIRNTKQLLAETEKNRELTYERYLTIRQQVEMRNDLIVTIQEEINSYDRSLERTANVIVALGEDIEHLKSDYQQLLKMAYKRKLAKSDLLFLFSAKNFNESFKRWQYLKQYDKYRKKQARRIVETQSSLTNKIKQQAERKLEKQKLLESAENQLLSLEKELVTKNKLLKELKSNARSLRRRMKRNQVDQKALSYAIQSIIKKDVARKQRRTTQRTKAKSRTLSKSSKSSALAVAFEKKRGRLPWPVKGVVSSYFGKQDHPTLRDIIIDNSGIDILVRKQAPVKPVAKGKVMAVRFVPGSDYLIVVQHGHFFTLYSKLANHTVNKGDQVNVNTELGKVAVDTKTGKAELHFEVWRNDKRLNPLPWLKKY